MAALDWQGLAAADELHCECPLHRTVANDLLQHPPRRRDPTASYIEYRYNDTFASGDDLHFAITDDTAT